MATKGKGIKIKAGSGAKRTSRARANETTATMNGVAERVIARRTAAGQGKPLSGGAVLLSANSAKDKGNPHDALHASRVIIAAAYAVAKDQTNIQPNFAAFGQGVPVDLSMGLSIDASGKATVKVTCRVDGREVVLGD